MEKTKVAAIAATLGPDPTNHGGVNCFNCRHVAENHPGEPAKGYQCRRYPPQILGAVAMGPNSVPQFIQNFFFPTVGDATKFYCGEFADRGAQAPT